MYPISFYQKKEFFNYQNFSYLLFCLWLSILIFHMKISHHKILIILYFLLFKISLLFNIVFIISFYFLTKVLIKNKKIHILIMFIP